MKEGLLEKSVKFSKVFLLTGWFITLVTMVAGPGGCLDRKYEPGKSVFEAVETAYHAVGETIEYINPFDN